MVAKCGTCFVYDFVRRISPEPYCKDLLLLEEDDMMVVDVVVA
jgi:hypothetical protein